MKRILFLITFILFIQQVRAQEVEGKWYGKTTLDKNEEHFIFDLRRSKEGLVGYLDLPSEKIFRVKLDSVGLSNGDITISHQGLKLKFSGKIDLEKNIVPGEIQKADLRSSLILSRNPQVLRTQTIKEPVPYKSLDITFYNKDSTKLAGTLSFPEGTEDRKAVILISGSGPQDRDSEILGHKPFKVLADHLSRNGIIVLRYDDRGYGESEGQFRPATSRDYADDVMAAVKFLNNFEEVEVGSIGLIGHSEGGNIAPTVAAMNEEVDFLILLAAPGTSNYESYLVSLDLLLKDYPETYDRDFELYKSVYKDMATINDKTLLVDSLSLKFKRYAEMLNEKEVEMYGGIQNFVAGQIETHSTEWYHYYLQFDVTPYLEELNIPILALNGDKDTSVEADFNLGGIEKTLEGAGNNNFRTVKLENVNHFFQTSKDDKIESVYFNKETFSKKALREISDWIKEL